MILDFQNLCTFRQETLLEEPSKYAGPINMTQSLGTIHKICHTLVAGGLWASLVKHYKWIRDIWVNVI